MYITQFNFLAMSNKVTVKNIDIQDIIGAYKQLSEILSEPEEKRLTAIKYIAQNTKESLENIEINDFSQIIREDSRRYVIPEKQPVYHIDSSCDLLNSDYYNLLIPKQIHQLDKNSQQDEVQFYRSFFPNSINENNIVKVRGLVQSVRAYYLSKHGIELHENDILEEVKRNNTGSKDLSTQYLIDDINGFLDNLKYSNNKDDRQVYNMRYFTPSRIKHLSQSKSFYKTAEQFADKKQKLFNALIQDILIQNNFDKNGMSEDFLMKMGFACCRYCVEEKH